MTANWGLAIAKMLLPRLVAGLLLCSWVYYCSWDAVMPAAIALKLKYSWEAISW